MPTTRFWTPRVSANLMTVTVTVTAFDAATTYKITIGQKTVSVVGDTNVNTTASDLQAALAASTEPEFQEITWTVSTATITGTAANYGKPFTATSSVSGGTGTIGAVTTTVASVSPNDVGNASNWSDSSGTSGLPVSGDSIVIENSSVSLLYNADALAAVNIAACTVHSSFTGKIGLTTYDSQGGYYQYRKTFFQMATCTTLTVELSPSLSAESLKFDVGSNACTLAVSGNSGGTTGQEALWWKGTNVANAMTADGGSVALAALSSDSATLATINIAGGALVRGGSGLAAVTTANADGGSTLDIQSNVTTLTVDGGASATCRYAMTVGTLNVNSGSVDYRSSGTITTLALAARGSIDFANDRQNRTVTNTITMIEGSALNDPYGTVNSGGNVVLTVTKGRLSNCTVDLGPGRTYTVA